MLKYKDKKANTVVPDEMADLELQCLPYHPSIFDVMLMIIWVSRVCEFSYCWVLRLKGELTLSSVLNLRSAK